MTTHTTAVTRQLTTVLTKKATKGSEVPARPT